MTNELSCIEFPANTNANKTIIWLHGLGADGNDFVPIISAMDLPTKLDAKFVFPNAPVIPVTMNNNYKMRAWFDIYERNIVAKIDEEGILASVKAINQLIEHEMAKGVPAENIMLAGFSQGSVIALLTGLTTQHDIAGVIALSGYLPVVKKLTLNKTKNLPIFIAHGRHDMVVPYFLGQATMANLEKLSSNVDAKTYEIDHSVSDEEINDIISWIKKNWDR